MAEKRKCLKCGSNASVVETRRKAGTRIYRRIVCDNCGHKWSTWEITNTRYQDMLVLQEKTDRIISDVRKASRLLGDV